MDSQYAKLENVYFLLLPRNLLSSQVTSFDCFLLSNIKHKNFLLTVHVCHSELLWMSKKVKSHHFSRVTNRDANIQIESFLLNVKPYKCFSLIWMNLNEKKNHELILIMNVGWYFCWFSPIPYLWSFKWWKLKFILNIYYFNGLHSKAKQQMSNISNINQEEREREIR